MTKKTQSELAIRAMKRAIRGPGVDVYNSADSFASMYRKVYAERSRRMNERVTNLQRFTFA